MFRLDQAVALLCAASEVQREEEGSGLFAIVLLRPASFFSDSTNTLFSARILRGEIEASLQLLKICGLVLFFGLL